MMKEKYTGLGLIALGKRLYNCRRWINYRFLLVFYLRCSLHPQEVEELRRFLMATSLRQAIFEVNPQFFGQLTRCFFYPEVPSFLYRGALSRRLHLHIFV